MKTFSGFLSQKKKLFTWIENLIIAASFQKKIYILMKKYFYHEEKNVANFAEYIYAFFPP